MELKTVIEILKSEEAHLRAQGVEALAVFGSVARGEARAKSDVDLLARINRSPFGLMELAALEIDLEKLLGTGVDLLTEPVRKDRLRERIERDRAIVF